MQAARVVMARARRLIASVTNVGAGTDAELLLADLRELAGRPEVVAIGEIGLDFFRDLSPRPAQRTALRLQLDLARSLDLPVVFHIRDAYPETLQRDLSALGEVLESRFVLEDRLIAGLHNRHRRAVENPAP